MLFVIGLYLRINMYIEKCKYVFVGFLLNWIWDIGYICCFVKFLLV